jgi:hypothetical protein
VDCWFKRTIAGPGYIYELIPNYHAGNSVSVLIDANRGLRIYNYGGIATTDVSVSAIVDIEYDIAQ